MNIAGAEGLCEMLLKMGSRNFGWHRLKWEEVVAGFACGDGNTGIKFSVGLFRAVGGRGGDLRVCPKSRARRASLVF